MSDSPPADWTTVKLGDIGDALIGLTYAPSSVKRSGTLVLRSSNIQDNELAFEDNVHVDCSVPDQIRVRDNDILLCVRNGSRALIGKSALLDDRVVGQTFGAFMAVFRSDVNDYLRFYFQSAAFKQQVERHLGATINQITNASLKSFTLALPPQAERERIVAHLKDVEALISSLKRLIAKKEGIKQGMMQRLLAGQVRLPGFAEDWRSLPLRDDITLISGQHVMASDYNTRGIGTPYLTGPADFPAGRILRTKFTTRPSVMCRAHDLLLTVKGSGAGSMVEADADYCISRQLMAIRVNRWHPRFVFFSLQQNASKIRDAVTGLIPGLSRSDVLDQLIPLPDDPQEQAAIAEVLDDCERELALLGDRLSKVRRIKQGMAQQLLTGRVRLADLEAVA